MDKSVVNLSKSFTPTQAQHLLLSKGLSYIPTSQPRRNDKHQLLSDLQMFHRKVMLTTYFEGRGSTQKLPFTTKSTWTPRLNQLPSAVRKIITADNYAIKTLNWNVPDPANLSPPEISALRELRREQTIVLKPADKGSAVVIWDKKDYIWEAHRQLHNSNYYTKLDSPLFLESVPLLRDILEDLWIKKFISKKQKDYLMGPDNPRPRYFYLLPKIHKEPCNWSVPFSIPPGRPIVSDCESESYRVAELIDFFLQPISNKHPSYLRDSYDFINKIRFRDIPLNSFLFTIDVDNLYTNIETVPGLQAVREWFTRYPDSKRPDSQILQLLELSLTRNDFEFNSEYYLQIKGTAMGKKFAPAYANIYMAHWEESALASSLIKPFLYFRFLDDIWGIWTDTERSFMDFIEHLNHHHPSIKVKFTLDSERINFLDTITFKGPDFEDTHRLDVKVFFKDTDTHALLHRGSFHPKHTFRGIVKSQLLRFSRICTRQEDFHEATGVLFSALKRRGYSRPFLRGALRSFKNSSQLDSREPIPLITTYSSLSKNFNTKIKYNFTSILAGSSFLQKYRLISAFRKNKNLKDLLVRSRLKPVEDKVNTRLCPEFGHKNWVFNYKTKKIFRISPPLNANTKNCVYLIYCTKCPAQYVGETRNSLATRLNQHRYNLRYKKLIHTKLVQHFLYHGRQALKVMGLQSNPHWTWGQRKRAENRWIQTLGSLHPHGLNDTC